jgi:hypothetical protein
MPTRGSRFLDFLDFQFRTTEFGLAKEYEDQSKKRVFLYFYVLLPGNEFFGSKREKFTK